MWFRLSVFNFVECAVWRLMLVVFVVCVGGSGVASCSARFVLVNVGFVELSAF